MRKVCLFKILKLQNFERLLLFSKEVFGQFSPRFCKRFSILEENCGVDIINRTSRGASGPRFTRPTRFTTWMSFSIMIWTHLILSISNFWKEKRFQSVLLHPTTPSNYPPCFLQIFLEKIFEIFQYKYLNYLIKYFILRRLSMIYPHVLYMF